MEISEPREIDWETGEKREKSMFIRQGGLRLSAPGEWKQQSPGRNDLWKYGEGTHWRCQQHPSVCEGLRHTRTYPPWSLEEVMELARLTGRRVSRSSADGR